MKSMEFTKASVEKAVEAIKKHNEEFNAIRQNESELSIEEVAQKLIIDKFGDSQIEAQEIVADLKKGIANFDAQLDKNKSNERINVKECLEEATKNNTDEERKNCYVNILSAIQLLNVEKLSEDDVNAKLAENSALSQEELLTKIEECLNSSIELESLAEKVKAELKVESINKLAEEIELGKDEYRFMAAVWLYIEQREGNLKLSDSDFAISAEQIGTLAAASVEAIIANKALAEGTIDLATWQKVMKWIIGAAIGIALAYFAILVVANVSALAVIMLWTLFGTGTIALILSFLVAFYVGWTVGDALVEGWQMVMNAYADFYNKYIVVFTSKVSAWIEAVKAWFKGDGNKAQAADDNHTENPDENPVDNSDDIAQVEHNDDEQELQVQPDLA